MDSIRQYLHMVKRHRVSEICVMALKLSSPPTPSNGPTEFCVNLGKTYTVNGTDEDPGIKCRAVENLFKGNQSGTNRRQFIIRVGYVEIYNEMVYDLLNRRQTVHFDHDSKNMSNTEVIVKDRTTLLKLIQKGNNAQTPKTGNEPSISHTIFQIVSCQIVSVLTRAYYSEY